jgi:hypothetical protein
MGGFETALECALMLLLGVTLVHAVRLQRAIAALRKDRASLDEAVAGFDNGTRQAELGMSRMRDAAQTLSGQFEAVTALRDDLSFLCERGTQVADRLDHVVRAARPLEPVAASALQASPPQPAAPVRSQAERDLLQALRGVR